jgi:hypothetical protein
MGYLKEILAVCSTAIALFQLYNNGDGATMTAVIGFWGVLLGHEITMAKLKHDEAKEEG